MQHVGAAAVMDARGGQGEGEEGGREGGARVGRTACVLDVRLSDQSTTTKCGIVVVTFNVSFVLFLFLSWI